VTEPARRERTATLLIARLDALSRAASRIPNADAERLIERAAVATMHAVALELLEAERATAIWDDAHARHPELPRVELRFTGESRQAGRVA
jgi:hypothetical protein